MRKMLRSVVMLFALVWSTGSFAQTYCSAGPSSTADSEITNVVLTGDNYSISNLATCPAATGVQDFTGTDSADVSLGTSYGINVTFSTCGGVYTGYGKAWIDWNQDGDFTDAGEDLGSWGPGAPSPLGSTAFNATFSFTVPATASLGATRLRVMQHEGGGSAVTNPCATFTWGSVEDYRIVVTNTPPPCPIPGMLASAPTSTAAAITWSSTGSAFDIEYGPVGFLLGTGSTLSSTTTSVAITGLTPNTGYDVYVRNNCITSGNGTSGWSSVHTFYTTCASISTYPYSENFDGSTWITGAPGTVDQCWSRDQSTSVPRWQVNSGGTSSSGTGPAAAHSGTQYLYLETSGGTLGNFSLLTLPALDLSSLTFPLMSFYYHMYGASMGDLSVEVSVDTGATWTTVLTKSGQDQTANADPFKEELVDLTTYKTAHTLVRFRGVRGASFDGDMAIDDVKIEEAPPCPKPTALSATNITSSTALVGWLSSGSTFIIEYGPEGFIQGTGMLDTAATNSVLLSGLAPNTTYDVYVINDCSGSGNGLSAWAGPITFTTLCVGVTEGYFQNFDVLASGSKEPCWYDFATGGAHNVNALTPSSFSNVQPYSAPNLLYWYNNSSTMSYVVTPELIGLDGDTTQVRFRMTHNYFTSPGPQVWVGTMSDRANAATIVWVDTLSPAQYTWNEYTIQMNNVPTGHKFVVFGRSNTPGFSEVDMDDFHFEGIPACPPPTSATAVAASSTSVNLSWTGTGTAYNIEYGPAGYVQGTGATSNGVTSPTTLTGLFPNTCYDIYIQQDCGGGVVGPWYGPVTVCTPCATTNMPYTEDFNTWPPSCFIFTKTGSWDWDQDAAGYARARFWNFSTGSAEMTSGPINITQKAQVKFKWAHQYMTFYPDDQVLLLARVLGTTQWDTLKNLIGPSFNSPNSGTSSPPASASDFVSELLYLDSATYVGQVAEFRFVANTDFGPNAYVDDFVVEPVPTCPEPVQISFSNIQGYQAGISYNAITGNQFVIEYGPMGFAQGTGGGTLDTLTGLSGVITGLNPVTCYDVYIMTLCSNGTSTWAGPFNFCTTVSCPAPTNVNLVNAGQSTATINWTSGGASDWNYINVLAGLPPSAGTITPATSTTLSLTGLSAGTSYDFYVRDSCGVGDVSTWVGPLNYVTPLCDTTQQCDFTVYMYDSFGDGWNGFVFTIEVGGAVFNQVGSTFTNGSLDSMHITACNGYQHTVKVLAAGSWPTEVSFDIVDDQGNTVLSGANFTSASTGTTVGTFTPNCIPVSCPLPTPLTATNINSTSATLGWTSGASNHQLSFGAGITSPSQGTLSLATTNSVNQTGLMPNTQYAFYVRDICSAGDTSLWSGPYNFTTLLCDTSNQCSYTIYMYDSFGDGWNGFELDIEVSGNTQLTFGSTFTNGSSAVDYFSACDGYINDAVVAAVGSYPTEVSFDIIDYNGDTVVVGQNFSSTSAGTTVGSFTPMCQSSCPAPTNFATTNIACDEVTLTWTSAPGTILSGVLYGPTGFNPATSGTLVLPASSPLVINGLTPGTAYDAYLADSCATGTSTPMMLSFTTPTAPMPTISFTAVQIATTMVDATVQFDASASTNYTSLTWDFGGGITSNSAMATNTYTMNQMYSVTLTLTNGCGVVDSTFDVTITGIGIEETALARSLSIYPNPTNGAFTVSFEVPNSENVAITILDAIGREYQSQNMGKVTGAVSTSFDMSAAASGVYLVKITSDSGVITRRITVQTH